MLLPADAQLPLTPARAVRERRRAVVLAERVVGQDARLGRERVVDRDLRRSDRGLDLGEPRRPARLLARLAPPRRTPPGRRTRSCSSTNTGSSPAIGLTSFLPGISAAVSTATTPGAARTASRSTPSNLPGRDRRAADRDVQQALRLADVVDEGRRCRRHASARSRAASRGAPRAAAIPRRGGQAAPTSAASLWPTTRVCCVGVPPISVSALRSSARAASSAVLRARPQVVDRREVLAERRDRRRSQSRRLARSASRSAPSRPRARASGSPPCRRRRCARRRCACRRGAA